MKKLNNKTHKAFCPVCGELKINEKGKIEHSAEDKFIAKMLETAFSTTYTY